MLSWAYQRLRRRFRRSSHPSLFRHFRSGARRASQMFRRMWKKPMKELPEPLHLFPAVKRDQFLGDRPLHLAEPGPDITCSHREASQRYRRSFHLIDRPKRFPQRMVSDRVVLHSILKLRRKYAGLSCPYCAVMRAKLFGECASLPPFHSSRDHGDMVNGSALHRCVPADCFEAFAAKYLACEPILWCRPREATAESRR